MSTILEPKTPIPATPVRPEIAPPGEVSEKPYRRRWVWIVLAGVAAVALIAGFIVIRLANATLLDENFNDGSGTFPTGTNGAIQAAYVNDAYQVTVVSTSATSSFPSVQFSPNVDAITVQADVSFPAGTAASTYGGVMALTSGTQGYVLAVGTDGSVGLLKALNLQDPNGAQVLLVRQPGTITATDQPITVRLEVEPNGGAATLTPIVNGQTIGTANDPSAYTTFSTIGLYPEARSAGQSIVFDNVLATRGAAS